MKSCSLGETTTFVGPRLVTTASKAFLSLHPTNPGRWGTQSREQVLKGIMSRVNSYLSITFAKTQHGRGWVEAVIATAKKKC